MKLTELRKLLAKALREKKKFIEVEPGGRGSYDFEYDPTYELEVGGDTLRLEDQWCGESQNSGYCYRQFISAGENSWRVENLDGVSRKLLDKIPIASDADIEKEFADVL